MASQALLRSALLQSRRSSNKLSLSRVFLSTAPQKADSHESESFLTGTSSVYAEQMYENYLHDPSSVHESWRRYFDNLKQGVAFNESEYNQPTAVPPSKASRRQAPQAAVSIPKRAL